MPRRIFPPFRAEHLGSLKRPDELHRKREEFAQKRCTAEELRVAENEAIGKIIQLQRDVGIKSITDGEYRRTVFFEGVFNQMEGMKYMPAPPSYMYMDYLPDTVVLREKLGPRDRPSYVCVSKLKRTKPFYVAEFEALKALTRPEEHGNLKLTMCSPEWYHLRHGEYAYPKDVYKNDEEYFADIAAAYRAELQDLYAAGCRNVQIDAPLLTYFCNSSMIKGMAERGIDHEALFDTYIRAYNACIEGRPADMTVGLHLCRGNFKGGLHFSEGGYDRIAIKLFTQINVDAYYLEYDTPRAGTFEPLKFLPKHETVVLGLVTSKSPQLENKEELKHKVYDAAEVIAKGEHKRSVEEALDQICISPQCGFASHSDGNPITIEEMRKKLELVVETAREIWSDA